MRRSSDNESLFVAAVRPSASKNRISRVAAGGTSASKNRINLAWIQLVAAQARSLPISTVPFFGIMATGEKVSENEQLFYSMIEDDSGGINREQRKWHFSSRNFLCDPASSLRHTSDTLNATSQRFSRSFSTTAYQDGFNTVSARENHLSSSDELKSPVSFLTVQIQKCPNPDSVAKLPKKQSETRENFFGALPTVIVLSC